MIVKMCETQMQFVGLAEAAEDASHQLDETSRRVQLLIIDVSSLTLRLSKVSKARDDEADEEEE